MVKHSKLDELNALYLRFKSNPNLHECADFLAAIRNRIVYILSFGKDDIRKHEDDAQELLLRIADELPALDIRNGDFSAWLTVRAKWHRRDCWRRRNTAKAKRPAGEKPIIEIVIRSSSLEQYWPSVSQAYDECLADGDWEVPLLLSDLFGGGLTNGKTLKEIAQDEGISEKSLKQKIARWAKRRKRKAA